MIYQGNAASPLVVVILVLALVAVAALAYFLYKREAQALKETSDEIVEKRPERLRNILWNPMLQELSQVVLVGGHRIGRGSPFYGEVV